MLRGLVMLKRMYPAPPDPQSQATAKVVADEITVKARSSVAPRQPRTIFVSLTPELVWDSVLGDRR